MANGWKSWSSGDVLTAADLMNYVENQVVTIFGSAALRDAAITAPIEGQFAYTSDTNTFWQYDGSAWRVIVTTMGGGSGANLTSIQHGVYDSYYGTSGSGMGTAGSAGKGCRLLSGKATATVSGGKVAFTFSAGFTDTLQSCVVQPIGTNWAFFAADSTYTGTNQIKGVPYTAAGAVVANGTSISCLYIATGN